MVWARSDTSGVVVGLLLMRGVGAMMHGGTPAAKTRLDSLACSCANTLFHLPIDLILFMMYIKNYGHMKMNAAINAMLKLRLQNGYRADEQQRSTARPPGLYILHLLFICDRLVLSLDNLHDVFLSVYSCCAVSYLHANRCCRSQRCLFLFLKGNQQC